jgi:hypothetical protein
MTRFLLPAALAAAFFLAQREQGPAPLRTPYARQGPLEIRGVTASPTSVPRFGRVELAVDLSATYDNPFDSRDIGVDVRITGPSRQETRVPGFLYRPYTRELQGGKEILTPSGEPAWRVRYCPQEPGAYTAVVTARDRSGTVTSQPVHFTCAATPDRTSAAGLIHVSRRDRRSFEFDAGKAYFPVGANVCWGRGRGTFDYDDWFPAYGRAGCNYARLWLSPQWTTFALERAGKTEEGLGMGQFDLGNAWRLDRVLQTAGENGLYLMLCIDSYNILKEKDSYPEWEKTPHNRAHGGPLARPTDFWTSPEMDRLYRDKLRYLVARYGSSPHVLSWEFWNEVDGVTGYQTAPVRAWHARMAEALRDLDPYKHPITTSFGRSEGDREVDTLPGLDYVQTHHYGSADLAVTVAAEQARKAAYGKPHYVGEIGADAGGHRGEDDPQGLQIHDPLWVSVAAGGSGAAAPWWWDSYIHPRNLYPVFTPLSRFVDGVDWPAEEFRPVPPRLEWKDPPNPLPRSDLFLEGGPVSWSASPANRPHAVQVTRAGAKGELPLAGIQHGVANHKDLHNPITVQTDLPWPSRFEVEVGDVSGYGGAALKITLDGAAALEKEFPDPDGDKDPKTLTRYAGRYGVDVPAGKHVLVAENTGKDWFMVGFRFRDAVERTSPPLLAWAVRGNGTVLAWARVEGRSWRRVCAEKETVPPAPPSVLVLPGLKAGSWRAEVWDTWSGTVLRTSDVKVPASGEARIALPPVEKDVAVKLRRVGAAPARKDDPPRGDQRGRVPEEKD